MTRNYLAIGILLLVVVILAGFSALKSFGGDVSEYSDTDPVIAAAYWAERIKVNGAQAAYAEFKTRNVQSAERGRHLAAHIIGEKIFESEGVLGIRYCDASFSFGCYHGFFGQAFARGGAEAIEELDAVCVRAFGPLGTGCQHGMGHGVLEYVGYQNIGKALLLCEKTTQSAPLLGCASGVFMEYNTPLVGISDTVSPETRKFSKETFDEPCRSVADSYKKSCYFELGGWLESALYGQDTRIGEVCSSLPTEWRSLCFQGFGALVPQRVRYDSDKSHAVCDVFSVEDALSCRSGVAWAMYSVPEHRGKTEVACAYSNDVMRERCMKQADLTEGKSQFPNL